MASYGDVLSALKDFRNKLEIQAQLDMQDSFSALPSPSRAAFSARGGISAFATPITNVHASGAGIRVRGGKPMPNEYVIKVYVFEKFDLGSAAPGLTSQFQGIEVDVEPLPIQKALQRRLHKAPSGTATPINRARHRPVLGGTSIAPINEPFVGTLGCFLARQAGGVEQIFALSNNHVLVDTNRLTVGTAIVQPGGEEAPTREQDVFAALSSFIPLQFPRNSNDAAINRFDAALAIVTDQSLIDVGKILGVTKFQPELATAVPGMRVIKSGRTTGVTTGTVTATRVNGVQVDYGTRSMRLIATFNDTIEIIGDDGKPFSAPGDSGSVILEEATGRPVALLFAGDGRTTTACDLGGVCQHFQAYPV